MLIGLAVAIPWKTALILQVFVKNEDIWLLICKFRRRQGKDNETGRRNNINKGRN